MGEEQQLIVLGWPLDDAFCICRELRREGTLSEFMAQQWANRDPVPNPETEVFYRASIQS